MMRGRREETVEVVGAWGTLVYARRLCSLSLYLGVLRSSATEVDDGSE